MYSLGIQGSIFFTNTMGICLFGSLEYLIVYQYSRVCNKKTDPKKKKRSQQFYKMNFLIMLIALKLKLNILFKKYLCSNL